MGIGPGAASTPVRLDGGGNGDVQTVRDRCGDVAQTIHRGLGSVSIEAVVLAVTAVVRPTTIAAVLAMLALPRHRRLLIWYLGAGLPFSIGVGILVVLVLGGPAVAGRAPSSRPIVDIVLGV